jgi:preprotein translocase subunit SecE
MAASDIENGPVVSLGKRSESPAPALALYSLVGANAVAKTSPIEFLQQVRTETKKVVWPTRKETVTTGVMVVIMTTVLALFFLAVDTTLQAIVTALLKLAN